MQRRANMTTCCFDCAARSLELVTTVLNMRLNFAVALHFIAKQGGVSMPFYEA